MIPDPTKSKAYFGHLESDIEKKKEIPVVVEKEKEKSKELPVEKAKEPVIKEIQIISEKPIEKAKEPELPKEKQIVQVEKAKEPVIKEIQIVAEKPIEKAKEPELLKEKEKIPEAKGNEKLLGPFTYSRNIPDSFTNKRGVDIRMYNWYPKKAPPQGLVFILHGLGEHAGRFEGLAKFLASNDYAVFALDHQGHGKSGGERLLIFKDNDLLQDIEIWFNIISREFPATFPRFLFGHSMGGGLAIKTMYKHENWFRGAILSAPAVVKGEDFTNALVLMCKLINFVSPRTGLKQIPPESLSSITEEVNISRNDPLVCHNAIPAATGIALLNMLTAIQAGLDKITWPFFIYSGSDDKLADPKGAKLFFEKAGSRDKEIKIFDKNKHEVHHDVGKDELFNCILNWLNTHTNN